jgi:hypothetical protein
MNRLAFVALLMAALLPACDAAKPEQAKSTHGIDRLKQGSAATAEREADKSTAEDQKLKPPKPKKGGAAQ